MTWPPDMGLAAESTDRDVQLSDRDFARVARLVHQLAGIVLADAKRPLVQSRLIKRLRALNLPDFGSYADYLATGEAEAERLELITAVTTNVTSFFREQHHFDTLTTRALPPLMARAQAGGRVRLWSAGCSSGEEPYSIAATVLLACPEAARLNIRILATDIDRSMIARTREGLYPAETVAALPREAGRVLFTDRPAADMVQISAPVRQMITCNPLNLQDNWPFKGPFDVIFCRNVVIYFDKPTQERLWQRFAGILAPGGYLMIGHSERVSGPALDQFSVQGITTYQRR
ncbi:MAG: protein-glutamate O-methyltransferase [Cypionkella sp.]|nr:protein-glutamate O-methyltransferase [Cypionkella sp.]